MLCSKCQQNEATSHFTFVVNGVEKKAEHFCKDCAPPSGLEGLSLDEIKALSIVGKKCEFCGANAFSGVRDAGYSIYWCYDCGLERSQIVAELLDSENPGWKDRAKAAGDFSFTHFDPELLATIEAISRKAVQVLKERRKQDKRDKEI